MKRIFILSVILIVLCACKKNNEDSTPNETNLLGILQLRWEGDDIIEENDTIDVLINYKHSIGTRFVDGINYYQPTRFYEDYTFEWNINDEVSYTASYISHEFQYNGINKVTLTAIHEDNERVITFYVKVFGCLIVSDIDIIEGLFIDESDNSHRAIFTREGYDNVGYEYNGFELISRKILDQFSIGYFEMVDFSKDINGFLNLWTWNVFYKYDKHADLIFEIDNLYHSFLGSIYISSENDYILLGTNSYYAMLYSFDQNGGNYTHETLNDNSENIKYKDGLMLTDSTCVVLIENLDEEITRLVKINLSTNEENILMVLPEDFNRITRTKEGFLISVMAEKNIAYFNQNLDMLWNIEVDLYNGFAALRHVEFEDKFLIINSYELISISKQGEAIIIKENDHQNRFLFRSIAESSEHALILADFFNRADDSNEDDTNYTIMYVIDKDGNLIE